MKKCTQKRAFLVNEVQDGVSLYSTTVYAASYKSLWRTALMRRILLNMSFDSVLDIKELENGKRCD